MLKDALTRLRRVARPEQGGQGVTDYSHQLSFFAIAMRRHRAFVGGLWDEVGTLQFDFMRRCGLLPEHKLADVGCGALRGGIHFIQYLQKGNYYGLDINKSLVKAGKREIVTADLSDKEPNLLISDRFDLSRFEVQFDYALAISLFTHLYMNHIAHCLLEVGRALKPEGAFYATYFEAPTSAYARPIEHSPDITTHYDSDPFHYSFSEMEALADLVGMRVERVSDWNHPRAQRMLSFTRA